MSQLANMCFLFSLMQALVLRSTSDLRVWKTFIFCLLVGDIGHLYSLKELGVHKYWDLMSWTISDLGIPVSYFGMALRIAFLAGIGMGGSKTIKAKKTA
ncbi:hypothetical protein QBC35DRAFT_495936 [Podospora australis]|uniref:DUF7704 domain-containing protein n=1 Tax=Podospora australis TaxID=1536484 RepID=A0AAN6WY31_9PEZI|nr:hypothetical protein QBC35DRAFT_495936 [Podospora australis]